MSETRDWISSSNPRVSISAITNRRRHNSNFSSSTCSQGFGIFFFFSFLDGNQTRGIINIPYAMAIFIFILLSQGQGGFTFTVLFSYYFPSPIPIPTCFPAISFVSLDFIYLVSTLVSPFLPQKREKSRTILWSQVGMAIFSHLA